MFCSVLQCVLQCVAVCCSVCCSVLQCFGGISEEYVFSREHVTYVYTYIHLYMLVWVCACIYMLVWVCACICMLACIELTIE